MNNKFSKFKLLSVLLCSFLLTSCSSNSVSQKNTASQSSVSAESSSNNNGIKNTNTVTNDMVSYEADDYYSDWKDKNPNYIELSGAGASLKGSGATISGSKITITSAGVYAISGKLDNGQIIVDVQNKGIVRLILNGMEINCADNAPVYVKNAGKTIITLQEGTQNLVKDRENYTLSDAETDEPDAAIFSKDNLTINGTGTLTVNANYKDGIASKDDLKITGGNININSKDDGLLGRDVLDVKDGNIVIKAGGDAVKSTNDVDATKGFIAIDGGAFNITAGTDAIQAKTSVLINNGKFTISSGGGSANSSAKIDDARQNPWGSWQSNTTTQSSGEEEQSAKGIKAASDITINGGTFRIDSSDDAIHSNNSINIAGGDISIASGDDGIHSDASIEIKGGKVNITKSYEGIESSLITVSDGETYIVSSDDGFNVSGGNDGSSVNGRPGQNSFAASPSCKLNINGGYISVDALGDGLDSNGSIYFTNGTVVVSGPTANNNGAIDYNGTFEMSGGFLAAAGSAGMAEAPSDQSTQYSINMYFSKLQQAGTLVNLKDSKGNTIFTFAPKKEYQSLVISSPELKKDAEYTIYTGGSSTGTATDGLYADGTYKDGTKIVDFTISNVITYMSETGETSAKSFNPGGQGDGRDNPGFGMDQGPSGKVRP